MFERVFLSGERMECAANFEKAALRLNLGGLRALIRTWAYYPDLWDSRETCFYN